MANDTANTSAESSEAKSQAPDPVTPAASSEPVAEPSSVTTGNAKSRKSKKSRKRRKNSNSTTPQSSSASNKQPNDAAVPSADESGTNPSDQAAASGEPSTETGEKETKTSAHSEKAENDKGANQSTQSVDPVDVSEEDDSAEGKRSQKINAEDIKGIILRKIPFARIDGRLCYFNGKYFTPIKSQSEVESLIYNSIPGILQGGSIRLLKDAAYIIFRLHYFPDSEPAEALGYIGFSNGIYQSDRRWFFSFEEAYSVDSSYSKINPPLRITHLLNVNFLENSIKSLYYNAFTKIISNSPYNGQLFPTPQATHAFFAEIAGDNPYLYNRIWEMLACILVPDPSIKKFFLLEGIPDSGKSVLGNFIKSFFYPENVSSLDFSRLGDKFSASVLPGTYLNVSMDLPNRTISSKSIAMLKMLTGDDDVTVEAKHQNACTYRNRCRFLFGSNHHLKLAEDDQAFINRLVLIPFRTTPKQKDPYLLDRLKQERDLVAAWAVQVYYPIIKNANFVFSGTDDPKLTPVVTYPDKYTNQITSQLQAFADKYCIVTGNADDYVFTEKLRIGYADFCERNDYHSTCDMRQFTRLFKEVVGDSVWFQKRHTILPENGERREVNQSCCFGLKYLEEPMTFDE